MKRRQIVLLLLITCSFAISCQSNKQKNQKATEMNDTSKYSSEVEQLVLGLRHKGIADERILDAIGKIPRHEFVSDHLLDRAYEDKPLPIDKEQTISQPYTVAFQTELLELEPGDKVLEIGTGSGYQAAVLCEMGVDVYSIERHQLLYKKAQTLLDSLGYHPHLFYGDGYQGLTEHAPFDKILITAATKEFPPKLLKQLKVGGLMVAPIGDSVRQVMTVIRRLDADRYEESEHGIFIFVPMIEGVED